MFEDPGPKTWERPREVSTNTESGEKTVWKQDTKYLLLWGMFWQNIFEPCQFIAVEASGKELCAGGRLIWGECLCNCCRCAKKYSWGKNKHFCWNHCRREYYWDGTPVGHDGQWRTGEGEAVNEAEMRPQKVEVEMALWGKGEQCDLYSHR